METGINHADDLAFNYSQVDYLKYARVHDV